MLKTFITKVAYILYRSTKEDILTSTGGNANANRLRCSVK